MAKKLTNNGARNGVAVVGLDIGYGITKALTDAQTVVFPSVWGVARELKHQQQEIAAKYPGDQMSDDDGDWFMGELALSQLTAAQQRRLRGRTADEKTLGNVARLRLAKVALGKLFADTAHGDAVHVAVATGLPVDHMRGAGELKEAFIGQHAIQSDQSNFIVNITDVIVMPQPYGTIYREMLTPTGDMNPCHTARRTGVVDVGTFTVDVTYDDDGEYVDVRSGSTESGVFAAHDVIANAYERDFQEKPSQRDIDEILRTGCVRFQGTTYDYSDETTAALTPLREATLNLMGEKWGRAGNVDVIYLSGGGAILVFDDVRAAYPQTALVNEPQLANARGYLNYAHRRASQNR